MVEELKHSKVFLHFYYCNKLDRDGGFLGPERVWLKDIDVPGLAMSRSFGDTVAASVGVIAIPGMTKIFSIFSFTKNKLT